MLRVAALTCGALAVCCQQAGPAVGAAVIGGTCMCKCPSVTVSLPGYPGLTPFVPSALLATASHATALPVVMHAGCIPGFLKHWAMQTACHLARTMMRQMHSVQSSVSAPGTRCHLTLPPVKFSEAWRKQSSLPQDARLKEQGICWLAHRRSCSTRSGCTGLRVRGPVQPG